MIFKLPDSVIETPMVLKDQIFDLKGLTFYSALSVSTLRDHIRRDGLPAFQVGGKILVKKSEFDEWILKYRVNKSQDLNALANEVFEEIGVIVRRSKKSSD